MLTIPEPDIILEKLMEIHEKCKENKDISEKKLMRYFHKSGILEKLGYDEDDIHVEETVKDQKRTDIHVTDDYGNVRAVIEFKKPTVRNLVEHFDQLWNRYMKPLKAKYGLLYNGFELYFYERIRNNYDKKFGKNVLDLERKKVSTIVQNIKKPEYDLTQIGVVADYLKEFEDPQEKLNLKDEASREHFFENFKLKKDSAFGDLLRYTIDLFNEMESKGEFGFLKSAYDFWKMSYAKKPDKVPKNWKPIMEECGLSDKQEDLYKFMFCLETTYALFTRLILAKSAEDYEFADIKFVGFIETEIERASFRGDIPRASWAKITQDLVSDMRDKLVSSVFEEDIFYWWTEPYEGRSFRDFFKLSDEELTYAMDEFGEKIRKILLTFCKFDFSEIKGDPLGILYQRYFDKDTRKALGEFYTPQEVVDYILDSVDYEGRKVLDKRLLDPACGSGTFLVTALKRYLEASEDVAEDKGWDWVLDNLCNNYRIVGFDIHPFATIMAQIQFMLVLLPYYKRAIEDDPRFVLKRVPIFRTDSLVDESETGDITLKDFENGKRFSMKVQLPVEGEEGEFFEESFLMPHSETVLRNTDIYNNEEYFGALQGLFDVVKKQAEDMDDGEIPEFDEERFEAILKKHYLSDKDWSQISSFFRTFGNELIEKIYELQTEFDDGRLIKSIEDIFLAALLKNEQKYDYVVGNPPYVEIQTLGDQQKENLENDYQSTQGNYDIYLPFLERGISWLDEGLLGYITPNRFAKVNYGRQIRNIILKKASLLEYIDFKDSNIFEDAVNYPAIEILQSKKNVEKIKVARFYSQYDFQRDEKRILEKLRNKLDALSDDLSHIKEEYFDCFLYPIDELESKPWIFTPDEEKEILNKIKSDHSLIDVSSSSKTDSALFEGLSTGAKKIFTANKKAELGENIKIQSEKNGEIYEIEKDKTKPYIDDAGKWQPEDQGQIVIFPYESGKPIDGSAFKKEYPKTYEYLSEFKEKLESRRSLSKNKQWFEYSAPRSLQKYEKTKIMVNGFSQTSSASIDKESSYVFGPDIYGLQIKEEYKKYSDIILSIINSDITNFYIKECGVVHRGSTYKFEDRFLKYLPIRLKEKEEIDLKIINGLKELKKKISLFPQGYYPNTAELVSKKYSSDVRRRDITPKIQKSTEDEYQIVIGKRKIIELFKTETEDKAEFLKKSLDGLNLKKNSLVEILVPKSNKVVKNILKQYEEDREKLEEMPNIEKLEEEINEIVYELYDLNDDDIEVIEEFLEKF